MKLKLLFLGLFVLISAVIWELYNDQHIFWKFKLISRIFKLYHIYLGIGGEFSRERYNHLRSLEFPTSRSTNGSYINDILIEDVYIPSEWEKEINLENRPQIKLEIYEPVNLENKSLPVFINIHGGGFVFEGNFARLKEYAALGVIVVDVIYRLSPESKFPAALEDTYSALQWIGKKEHRLLKNANLDQIVVIGESAGGNIAAVLCLLARDRQSTTKISHQILIYPAMFLEGENESTIKHGNGYILNSESGKWYAEQYLENNEQLSNQYVNPMKAESLKNLPQTLFIMATDDMLYTDGLLYKKALDNAGVRTEWKEYVSVHGFYSLVKDSPVYNVVWNDLVEYLKKVKIIS